MGIPAAERAENKKSSDLDRHAEKATQNRDLALGTGKPTKGTVEYYTKASRDILLGVHKGSEQTLGDWGFEVDTSARKAAKPATAAPRVRPRNPKLQKTFSYSQAASIISGPRFF